MTYPDRIQLTEGYSVSRLIVGGWQFSQGHGARDHGEEGADFLARLVEAGLTTFDCADIYQGVEGLIGRFLRQRRRSGHPAEVQVHTKFVPDLEILPRIDKAYVRKIIHRSLIRLGVERLDLVQFHWWDFSKPRYVEVAHWLKELQEAGDIRFLGVTNFDFEHLTALVDSGVPVLSSQVQYSVLDRRPEGGLARYCQENGIALLCYGALAGGFLTNRYLGVEIPPAELANRSLTKYRLIIDELGGWSVYQEILGALATVARRHGTPLPSIALRWVLDQVPAGATITGMDSADQANQLLGVFDISLDEEDRHVIRAALEKTEGPAGPVYGLEREMEGPHGRIMRYNLNQE